MFSDLQALTDFLSTGLRLSIPLVFAALGGTLSERAGVFNVALEGCLLAGAFGAALGSFVFISPYAGLLTGIGMALLVGGLLAILAVRLGVNQLVAGLALNILVLGLTSYLSRLLLTGDGRRIVEGFAPYPVPFLADIPLLGPLLFKQDVMTYLMYATVALSWWMLWKTPWGLVLRAVGENPRAVDTAGMAVDRARIIAVLAGCAVAGLGGCYLVLSQVFLFTEHMSAGKGFLALAAVILGRWNPLGALAACLLFGLCDALQLRLQFGQPDVPYQLFSIVPFVASFLALVLFSGKVKPPASIGIRYERGGK
ncbi:ABC transporter permease [Methylobacterium planeticum]|uniref:ABC transporter permease n=2 Tax=Methylobacterium planeticum TaxID=2615211 RepID=A0A6N6MIC1_9HYPH|nr:ABC transporter permease [Methylobacterium planeticum]